MPGRVNGIGTTYLGKSKLLTRPGGCESCGRVTGLLSYDTRLWFTLLFIPLVPLGRKRVLDYCSACTTHRAMPLDEWEALKAKTLEAAARRALEAQADAEAQVELHRACLLMGEWEKADALRLRLEEDFARDAKVQLYLAGAHAYLGRTAEAEAAFQRARAIDPAVAPAEQAPSAPPPTSRAGGRRAAVVLAVLAAVALAGFSAASLVMSRFREVHLVNGHDQALSLEIDGRPAASVPAFGRTSFRVAEGRYRARVVGPSCPDVEFAVESPFLERLFDDRVFVVNPGGVALLVEEETIYARPGVVPGPVPPPRLRYGQPFLPFERIHYAFSPFPASIEVKESSGTRKRRRIDVVDASALGVVYSLLANKRGDDALDLAEWAARSRPWERDEVLPVFVGLARERGKAARALALLRERFASRPVDVVAHRHYQGLREREAADLKAEYDAELAKAPENPDLLYLRGRLEGKISAARAYYDKALRVEPKHPWASFARGYGQASEGDWAGARTSLAAALDARPGSEDFQRILRRVRLALGETVPLAEELRARIRETPWLAWAHLELARVLVAAGKVEEARALLPPFRTALREAQDPNAKEHERSLEAEILYASADFEGLLKLKPKDPVALLELGRIDEAARAGGKDDILLALALAAALPDDAARRETAAAALEAHGLDALPLAKALRSGAEEDLADALDASVDVALKGPALAALAKRIPARGKELRERVERLNRLWIFPFHFLKRSLEGR